MGMPVLSTKPKRWLILYRAALLETDLAKMPGRIVIAGTAIQDRLRRLQGSTNHHAERVEIEYAIRNLRVAEKMK
jgi:hypothetical protein